MSEISTVRRNLLTEKGYAPYCGNETCRAHWPRTEFKRDQFECVCGWRSSFEPEFIDKVKAFRSSEPLRNSQPYGT
jgi:hypothetical protein